MKYKNKDREFLEWIHARFKRLGEDERCDWMQRILKLELVSDVIEEAREEQYQRDKRFKKIKETHAKIEELERELHKIKHDGTEGTELAAVSKMNRRIYDER